MGASHVRTSSQCTEVSSTIVLVAPAQTVEESSVVVDAGFDFSQINLVFQQRLLASVDIL